MKLRGYFWRSCKDRKGLDKVRIPPMMIKEKDILRTAFRSYHVEEEFIVKSIDLINAL